MPLLLVLLMGGGPLVIRLVWRAARGFVGHLGPKHGFTRVLLVSGDREPEVRRLADAVSIAQIYAGTSPEEKVAMNPVAIEVRSTRHERRESGCLAIHARLRPILVWCPSCLAVVQVWCCTETGEAPRRQGATTEHTGSM